MGLAKGLLIASGESRRELLTDARVVAWETKGSIRYLGGSQWG